MAGDIIVVPPLLGSEPNTPSTLTLLYPAAKAQATLILIPGGEGHLRFTEAQKDTRNASAVLLKPFAHSNIPLGISANVVIVDSPYEIFPYSRRRSKDHLDRIAAVAQFYRQRDQLPVWLMGHSWGSVSVTEFINRSTNDSTLIDGLIVSGSRFDIEIKTGIHMPVLFLHHVQDACIATPYTNAKSNFSKTKTLNKGNTEFLTVKGGESKGEPCRDGYHMYHGSYDMAAEHIAKFILRHLQ